MPDRARLAAHSAGQQNECKTLTLSRNDAGNTSKDNAVLGITGSIDSGKKLPFSLDKNRAGGSPPRKNVKGKLFNRWDGGCPTPYAILFA